MGKGNKIKNIFIDDIWKNVFYNNAGTYVSIINKELSKIYPLEPLSNYIKIGGGYAFKTSQYKKEGVPVIRISDFNNEKIDLSNCVYYEENKELSKYELKWGDIIICLTGGTIAKLGIVQENLGKLYMNQRVGRFDVFDKSKFEKEYVYWIAKSVADTIKNLAWGAAIPNVSPKHIEKIEFSIPPLNIQKGIIKFLNDLKTDSLKNEEYFNTDIERNIVRLHFNCLRNENISKELSSQLSYISQLRQSFLRETMQGKLVSNETSDGKTGAELLSEIQTEKDRLIKEKKIKKSKPLAPVSEKEIPFEIPENWTWCRLGEVCRLITKGSSPKWQGVKYVNSYSEGILFVTSKNVDSYKVDLSNSTFVTSNFNEIEPRSILEKGDLLTNIVGGSIGRTAMYEENFVANINQAVCLIRLFESLDKVFVLNLFNSSYIINEMFKFQFAPGRANLSMSNIENFLIPLPPIEIQNRIVAKLDDLMAFCDQLEEQVKQSRQTNELLLQQVLREALSGEKQEADLPMVAEATMQYTIPETKGKVCDQNDMVILTAYIIQELNTKDFGRVKLQKMLHLTEYHCRLETNLQYQQKVAGPYSYELENILESILKRNRFYNIQKTSLGKNSKVTYTALAGASQVNSFFSREFGEQKQDIDFVLNKFKDKTWEFCEMISTMYAVWNNRLLKNQPITNDELKKDFLAWDKEKIKFLEKLDYAIDWMKKENLIPAGFGKYIAGK